MTARPEAPGPGWRRRERLLVCLGTYAALLLGILLWPSASFASWVVAHTTSALTGAGLSTSLVGGGRVEFALNAAMVAPLAVLAVLLWPRWGWERWTAYAFVGACAVELVQGLFLPMRSAQFVDVVANTLGAGAGAILGAVLNGDRRQLRVGRARPGSRVEDDG